MRVLFVKLSSLGDVVQSMPLIDLAYKKGITVDWLIEEENRDILVNHPHLDRLITVCKLKPSNLQKIRSSIGRIRRNRYDAVIDLQGLLKSAFWVFFSRSSRKIGQKNCREALARAVLTDALPFEGPAIERYFYLFSHGIFGEDSEYISEKITMKLSESEKEPIDKVIKKNYLVLAPFSRWQSKLWPMEYWEKLIKLLGKLNMQIFVVGTRNDREYSRLITKGTGITDLTGQTTPKQLFYLFDNSQLAITLDSGAMHLAAASRTKLIALFGATDPNLTGPIDKTCVISSNISCSPCLIRNCPINNRCMRLITPEMVFRKVEKYLKFPAYINRFEVGIDGKSTSNM